MKYAETSGSLPAPAGAYSHIAGTPPLFWTAGFGPQDPATGQVPDGIAPQTANAMRNVERALHTAGLSLENVIKATVHLQHLHRDFADFDSEYRSWLTPPYPVRTTVGSDLMDILVEIDVIAATDTAPSERAGGS